MKILVGKNLSLEAVISVAKGAKIELTPDIKKKVKRNRDVIDKVVLSREVKYGITTGVGVLSNKIIDQKDVNKLQRKLILSHSAGVGKPLSKEIVRAAMLIKLNELAKAHSGVRFKILETLVKMLNEDVYPLVPEKGSLGASGDLAPLAHIALVMIGEGEVFHNGKKIIGKEALKMAGIPKLHLRAKEGLSLINGTAFMTAIGALVINRAENLLKVADIAGALSVEALQSPGDFLDERINHVRPHVGQGICAKNLQSVLKGSSLVSSDDSKVQDAYAIRCMPQVHGAVMDSFLYAKKVLGIEVNSVTDNPLIFGNNILSGGNFHGQPVALTMDFLGIALSEIGSISERRIARLLDSKLSKLPDFLVENAGINSGFMLAHYTAAALVSENKLLASPATVDSIPVSANQEDHVSMGMVAARDTLEILENVEYILAIELLCAVQGIDFHHSPKLGIGTKKAYDVIREIIPKLEEDRAMYVDIEQSVKLVRSGKLVRK